MQPWNDAMRHEDLGALHEEINRLPRNERTAIVLCDLEGLLPRDAARRLRWPFERLEWCLIEGRARLQSRMIRRGCMVPIARLAADCMQAAGSSISRRLIDLTVEMATLGGRPAPPAEEAQVSPEGRSATSIVRQRERGSL